MVFAERAAAGERVPVSAAEPVLRLKQGASIRVAGRGFAAGSAVTVWIFSTPRMLGQVDVDGDGTFDGTLPVPPELEAKKHTLQTNGVDALLRERSVSVGVVVEAPPSAAWLTGPTNVSAGELTSALTLTTGDAGGNLAVVTSQTTFALGTTSTGSTAFFADAGGVTPITQATVDELLDRLAGYFAGDEPLTAVAGLL